MQFSIPNDQSNEGHPVQVVTVDSKSRKFVLDERALSSILLSSDCKDRAVSVVSIAGGFRTGKSFLLNFLLRYLTNKGYEENQDWLKDTKIPLKGFSWKGGDERDTTGILMWSKPFIVTISESKDIAVLLMDTQGAFDPKSSFNDCVKIFGLSIMTSSTQVFNIMHNLQVDNLKILQTFTEYGRMAIEEEKDEIPFQKLMFLIRDWQFWSREHGPKGGDQLLNKIFETNDEQSPNEQLKNVIEDIRSCFNNLSCFLMPYPGQNVTSKKDFDGRVSSINSRFLAQLKILVPLLVLPSNLVVKKICGSEVTGSKLLDYFIKYIEKVDNHKADWLKPVFEANVEVNNRAAMADALNLYQSGMKALVGRNTPYDSEELEKKHKEYCTSSIGRFETQKFGRPKYTEQYLNNLKSSIQNKWTEFEELNNSRKRLQEKNVGLGPWGLVAALGAVVGPNAVAATVVVAGAVIIVRTSVIELWLSLKETLRKLTNNYRRPA